MFGFPKHDQTRSLNLFLKILFDVSFTLCIPIWFVILMAVKMKDAFPHRLSHPTDHVCRSSLNLVVYTEGLLSNRSYAFNELLESINLLRLLTKASWKRFRILLHLRDWSIRLTSASKASSSTVLATLFNDTWM